MLDTYIVFYHEKMIYLSDMAKRKINYSKTQCTFKNRIFLDEEKLVETKVVQTRNVTFSSFILFLQKISIVVSVH